MVRIDHGSPSLAALDVVDLPLGALAHELVAYGPVGGLARWRVAAFYRDGKGGLVGLLLFDGHLERLDVRFLRVGDGIEVDRPTSPFGVWASAFAQSATSDFDRYFALATLFSMMNAPPPSPLPLAAWCSRVDDGGRIGRRGRCSNAGCDKADAEAGRT